MSNKIVKTIGSRASTGPLKSSVNLKSPPREIQPPKPPWHKRISDSLDWSRRLDWLTENAPELWEELIKAIAGLFRFPLIPPRRKKETDNGCRIGGREPQISSPC